MNAPAGTALCITGIRVGVAEDFAVESSDLYEGLENPEEVYLVSSCEQNMLLSRRTRQLVAALRARSRQTPLTMVHQGCAGLYAAILHFAASGSRRVLVICDENDEELGQACLDQAGIGATTHGAGLRATPGVALVMLERKELAHVAPTEVCVTDCCILAKERGLQGTPLLLRKVTNCITRLVSDGRTVPISFEIDSPWSRTLMSGFSQPVGPPWLPTAETGSQHLLSLKPVRDLCRHQRELREQALLLMTLSGGGRIGLMRIAQAAHPAPYRGSLHPREIRFADETDWVITGRLRPTRYLEPQFRGLDDLVFLTAVPVEGARLPPRIGGRRSEHVA